MRLPAWIHLGNEVWYVYRDGGLMMEVYGVDNGKAYYMGTQPCNHDLSGMHRLGSPWKERMDNIRKIRIQI